MKRCAVCKCRISGVSDKCGACTSLSERSKSVAAVVEKMANPITLDFCIWLHRNADRLIQWLNEQDGVMEVPFTVVKAAPARAAKACKLCDRPIHGHGLCRVHYGRMKRAGVVGA